MYNLIERNNMNKEIMVGLAGLTAGIVITLIAQNLTPTENRKEYVAGSDSMHNQMMKDNSMSGSMNMMTASLKGKSGDEFDKAFLSDMIMHHQGAVDMANLALTNANHQEIKDLAKSIITSQTSEIEQMKQWEQNWFSK
jgi:uncharacterized protein (DUF305 family)